MGLPSGDGGGRAAGVSLRRGLSVRTERADAHRHHRHRHRFRVRPHIPPSHRQCDGVV